MTAVYFLVSLPLCANVTISDLSEGISSRLDRVDDFVKIKQVAKELGIKEAYLFGGSASAWAHYVYADLEREDGSEKFYKEHFDYDYVSIFRSNQDMDIAIDGTREQAKQLEDKITELCPYFQGKKKIFEVRLLKETHGDKDAIIGDPNFINQNSDSHSTGLIELVGDGKKKIQDVKDFGAETPVFLKDVFRKKLHFYYDSKLHATTKRYIEKKNPEIFGAVRALTKAFQYEIEIDDESWINIKRIINEFNPEDIKKNDPYVASWLEKNGPKLFQNAINIEYAWNKLEELGLRTKLFNISNSRNTRYSLAWWMNKEPLFSNSIGTEGKTAKELGITIVAHETNSFEAYESITKSHEGDANVFISRQGVEGENALLGNGFYAKKGRKGARDTGLTIRFEVAPNARLGKDFLYDEKTEFLIIRNKAILRVIPESIQLTPLDYFSKLAKNELIFDATDLGIKQRVMKKINNKLYKLDPKEISEIAEVVKANIIDQSGSLNLRIISSWFNLSYSADFPEVVEAILAELQHDEVPETVNSLHAIVESFSKYKKWSSYPNLLEEISKKKINDVNNAIIVKLMTKDPFSTNKSLITTLFNHSNTEDKINLFRIIGKDEAIAKWAEGILKSTIETSKAGYYYSFCLIILNNPYWKNRFDYLLIKIIPSLRGNDSFELFSRQIKSTQPISSETALWLIKVFEAQSSRPELIKAVLNQPYSIKKEFRPWILKLINTGLAPEEIRVSLFENPAWKTSPDYIQLFKLYVDTLKKAENDDPGYYILDLLTNADKFQENEERAILTDLLKTEVKKQHRLNGYLFKIFNHKEWQKDPSLIIEASKYSSTVDDSYLVSRLFGRESVYQNNPEVLVAFLKKPGNHFNILKALQENKNLVIHKEWIELLTDRKLYSYEKSAIQVFKTLVSTLNDDRFKGIWATNYDLLKRLIDTPEIHSGLEKEFKTEFWQKNRSLKRLSRLGGTDYVDIRSLYKIAKIQDRKASTSCADWVKSFF